MSELEILNVPDFDNKLEILRSLIKLRKDANRDLDQLYVSEETILRRIKFLGNLISDQRILAIGDSDLSALSISIFGNPKELVITDIDKRLTDLLFEANMEYNLPVRFVYHDMRIKIIEILLNQFTVIVMEPPQSKGGIIVFLSRALQCIQAGFEDQIFITIPSSGEIRDFFDNFCLKYNIQVLETGSNINQYENENVPNTDFLRLRFPIEKTLPIKGHWIEPFFTYEEQSEIKEYRCICHEIIEVGGRRQYTTIEELRIQGHTCGHKDIFAYHSKVKLL